MKVRLRDNKRTNSQQTKPQSVTDDVMLSSVTMTQERKDKTADTNGQFTRLNKQGSSNTSNEVFKVQKRNPVLNSKEKT